MEHLAKKISWYFLKKEMITPELYEWCVYTIHRRLCSFLSICGLCAVGGIRVPLSQVICFLAGSVCLRRYTSGFHAKTFAGCLIGSGAILIVSEWFIVPHLTFLAGLLLLVMAESIITKKAPFNHPNLRLSKDEIEFYKKRTRQCLILLNLLTVFLLMIGFNCCAYSVVMGMAVTAISLIVVK